MTALVFSTEPVAAVPDKLTAIGGMDGVAALAAMGLGAGGAGNLSLQGLVDFQRMWRIRLVLDQNETISSGAPALT